MKKRKFWAVAGVLSVLALSAGVWFAKFKGAPAVSFAVAHSPAQTASVIGALNLSGMTRDFVVSEGPCGDGGCNGGVLSQQLAVDLKEITPPLKGYNSQTTSVIWLYPVKPLQVVKYNDWPGENTLKIYGQVTRDHKFYFAVVPRQLVAPPLQWITVETLHR